MAGSVNKVVVLGHLGQDPEVRTFPNGGKVVNLSVATSESWKDKQSGERKEKTEWHRVQITNEVLAKVAEQYLRKGSKVYLEGKLATRKWQDQGGVDHYTTEIVVAAFGGELVLLDRREQDGQGGGSQSRGGTSGGGNYREHQRPEEGASRGGGNSNSGGGAATGGGYSGGRSDMDDEIPF